MAEEKMLNALPEEVTVDKGWNADTQKDAILREFKFLSKLVSVEKEGKEFLEEGRKEEKKPKNFVLVATEAEWKLDEEGYDRRSVINTIKEGATQGSSSLLVAHNLLLYNEDIVSRILELRGRHYLGKEASTVERLYKQLLASKELAWEIRPIVVYIDRIKEDPRVKESKSYMRFIQKYLKSLREKAEKYADEYGLKTIISFLPLHKIEFRGPTPKKERAVKKVFPRVSTDAIHEWLQLGNAKLHGIADEQGEPDFG